MCLNERGGLVLKTGAASQRTLLWFRCLSSLSTVCMRMQVCGWVDVLNGPHNFEGPLKGHDTVIWSELELGLEEVRVRVWGLCGMGCVCEGGGAVSFRAECGRNSEGKPERKDSGDLYSRPTVSPLDRATAPLSGRCLYDSKIEPTCGERREFVRCSIFSAHWCNLKWNRSRRFRSGPLLSKRTMNIDFRVIGRKG